MKQKKNCLRERDRQVYLQGVQRFMLRGIPVFIDDEMVGVDDLEQLFSPPEGTFYMADFVIEEMPEEEKAEECPENLLREGTQTPYSVPGGRKRYTLKEIRFDPAYHS